jgi:Zn-dependent protease
MSELIIGIGLLVITALLGVACYPKHGKVVALVRKPLVGPLVSILIVTGLTISVILIAAYFSNFDDLTLAGAKHL